MAKEKTPPAEPAARPMRWQYTGPDYREHIVLPGSLVAVHPKSWTEEEIITHLATHPINSRYFTRK
jgi:hypothetical protein